MKILTWLLHPRLLLALAVAAGVPIFAQFQTGSLYGTITDTDGNPLKGVTVTIKGVGAPQCKSTDDKGQLRFLGLDPGTYTLEAELDGFSRVVYEQLSIRVGRHTTLQLQMSAVLEETITVTTEPPLVDAGDVTSDITVTEFELDEIPTTRDPWAIVGQAPGVLVDRINVGGTESGQQALFVGPGASSRENAYVVDGVVITDMAAIGATPAYYDFDQLGEVQVTTGGGDANLGNAGVTLNLVTKRGTNAPQGSARLFVTDGEWQSTPNVDRADFAPGQLQGTTNRVNNVHEYGFELGGPLQTDRLWVWGAFARNDIDRFALGGQPDDIDLENLALKLNGQPRASTSAVAMVSLSDKDRFGRGAGVSRAPATLWDQIGGADLVKAEASHLLSPGLYLTAMYSVVDGDFHLEPRGGPDAEIYLDADGVWQGSFVSLDDSRDVEQLRLAGSHFVSGERGSHEIELELGRRVFDYAGAERWGPRDLIHYDKSNHDGARDAVEAVRSGPVAVEQRYDTAWVQDTWSVNRATLKLGLRYDLQQADNLPGRVAAHPVFPELLPAVGYAGRDAGFTWGVVSPRLGATWLLDRRSQSLLRLSYARFPSQLYTDLAARVQATHYSGAYLEFDDLDGDHVFDVAEPYRLLSTWGVDPADPSAQGSANLNDDRLQPEMTDELVVGLEHSPAAQLVLGLDLTYRDITGIHEARRLVRSTEGVRTAERDDYILDDTFKGDLPAGRGSYEVPVFTLRDSLEYTGGTMLTNGDREQRYLGVSLRLTKRMADRWMLRGHFTLSDWTWRIGPEFERFDDPTDLALAYGPDGLFDVADSHGDVVAEPSRERDETLFLNSRWSFNFASLYQVAPSRRWGFNVAANLHGREGFPGPYRVSVIPADGLQRLVQVTPRGDTFRLDDVYLLDLRVEKDFTRGGLTTVLSADVFNALNAGSVLERSLQLNGPQPDFLRQTLSPRIFRLGLRFAWH